MSKPPSSKSQPIFAIEVICYSIIEFFKFATSSWKIALLHLLVLLGIAVTLGVAAAIFMWIA